jgi:hypothetical protein
MPFVYRTGEEIKAGDCVTYHGEPGEVEFVVSSSTGERAMDWYFQQFPGGGFMVNAKSFGRVFLPGSDVDEDLEFVSRAGNR